MYARHKLVWLSQEGWQRAAESAPLSWRAHVDAWRRADRPAVVRRAEPGASAEEVCIGIALPPDRDGTKTRVPLRVNAADIKKVLPPLDLAAAAIAIPDTLSARYQSLVADAAERGLPLRVFGSVALQALTGEPYVTAASDIDLLFQPGSREEMRRGLALLDAHAAGLPLDGEIVFPSGDAVAWKEWLSAMRSPARPRVLAKGNSVVRLAAAEALLSTLKGE